MSNKSEITFKLATLENEINFTPSSFQKGYVNTTWNLRAHHVYILIRDYVPIVRRSMPDTRIGQFNLIFRPLFVHPTAPPLSTISSSEGFVTLESLSIAGRHLCPVACA